MLFIKFSAFHLQFEMGQSAALVASDSSDRSKEKAGDQKVKI